MVRLKVQQLFLGNQGGAYFNSIMAS